MARILHLADSTGVGGAPSALVRLVRQLDRARWTPTVVSLEPPGVAAAALRALGVEVLAAGLGDETGGMALLELLLAGRRLPRLLGGRRFEIVHCVGQRAHLLGRWSAPRLGARAVVNAGRGEAGGGWLARADRWSARSVSLFVVPWACQATELRRRLGVGPERCAVIPDGVDCAEADAALAGDREPARRRAGLFPTDFAIACVGRLSEDRGLAHLVGAFHALLQSQPTARLLIAGDGPARGRLESAVTALRLAPFVRFLGEIPEPWPLLSVADVFASPARRGGFPTALLEAMAARLPAVATAVGAVPEVAVDGREALLVPPGDSGALARALAELAASPERRRELGTRARRRVESAFRARDAAAAHERLFARLLDDAEAPS